MQYMRRDSFWVDAFCDPPKAAMAQPPRTHVKTRYVRVNVVDRRSKGCMKIMEAWKDRHVAGRALQSNKNKQGDTKAEANWHTRRKMEPLTESRFKL